MPGETPGQTVGPFFSIGMPATAGTGPVTISGRVLDGAGDPVPDAVVETWQRDPDAFRRSATGDDGRWEIRTIKPAGDTPHLAVLVYARGLLDRLATRIYFGDDPGAAADPTLLAEPVEGGYRFDIHLQGPHETTFFAR
jgi:protocatechuate 3,4-dioxygenase alpha subunit